MKNTFHYIILGFSMLYLIGATTINYNNKTHRENIKEIINNGDNYDIYIVTGKIIGKDNNQYTYIFSDGTGQIPIKIEDYLWQQINSKYPQIDIFLSILVVLNKENMNVPQLEAIRIRVSKVQNYNETVKQR